MKYLYYFCCFYLYIYIYNFTKTHTAYCLYILYYIGKEGRLKFIGHPLIKSSEFNIFTLLSNDQLEYKLVYQKKTLRKFDVGPNVKENVDLDQEMPLVSREGLI